MANGDRHSRLRLLAVSIVVLLITVAASTGSAHAPVELTAFVGTFGVAGIAVYVVLEAQDRSQALHEALQEVDNELLRAERTVRKQASKKRQLTASNQLKTARDHAAQMAKSARAEHAEHAKSAAAELSAKAARIRAIVTMLEDIESDHSLAEILKLAYEAQGYTVDAAVPDAEFDMLLTRKDLYTRIASRCLPAGRMAEPVDIAFLQEWIHGQALQRAHLVSLSGFSTECVALAARNEEIILIDPHMIAGWLETAGIL